MINNDDLERENDPPVPVGTKSAKQLLVVNPDGTTSAAGTHSEMFNPLLTIKPVSAHSYTNLSGFAGASNLHQAALN